MRLIRKPKGKFVFHLGPREQQLLLETLQLYPVVPPAHHRLIKSIQSPADEENQRLLEQALSEQRRENRRQVQAMLDQPNRFRKIESGFELTLNETEVEWLLQVLNDIRVGSWLALGEPDSDEEPPLTEKNASCLLALKASGMFQSSLLEALGVRESLRWLN